MSVDAPTVDPLDPIDSAFPPLAISPTGRIHVVTGASAPSTAVARRVVEAFERGTGAALLHLATVDLASHLPADYQLVRETARVFFTHLCALSELKSGAPRSISPHRARSSTHSWRPPCPCSAPSTSLPTCSRLPGRSFRPP